MAVLAEFFRGLFPFLFENFLIFGVGIIHRHVGSGFFRSQP
jgi:hypothetical protein